MYLNANNGNTVKIKNLRKGKKSPGMKGEKETNKRIFKLSMKKATIYQIGIKENCF